MNMFSLSQSKIRTASPWPTWGSSVAWARTTSSTRPWPTSRSPTLSLRSQNLHYPLTVPKSWTVFLMHIRNGLTFCAVTIKMIDEIDSRRYFRRHHLRQKTKRVKKFIQRNKKISKNSNSRSSTSAKPSSRTKTLSKFPSTSRRYTSTKSSKKTSPFRDGLGRDSSTPDRVCCMPSKPSRLRVGETRTSEKRQFFRSRPSSGFATPRRNTVKWNSSSRRCQVEHFKWWLRFWKLVCFTDRRKSVSNEPAFKNEVVNLSTSSSDVSVFVRWWEMDCSLCWNVSRNLHG